MLKRLVGVTLLALVGVTAAAEARDQIRIVGSSTVFPFAATVAERFGRNTDFKTPVVESNGSGGGLKLFCAGIGESHPDIANASRRIKKSEFENCAANDITVVEVKIGFDGIVLANAKSGADFALSKQQIFVALAKQVPVDGTLLNNPYILWSDIDESLPAIKIEVLGPPPTSGTRDAFVELAMEGGAKQFEMLRDLAKSDKSAFKIAAHTIREDGVFTPAGENDNLIVKKLQANPDAMGIFGFSFLDNNIDVIKGATVDGMAPTFENIAEGDYGVSRSLYFYVKKEHVGAIPGIAEFVAEFVSDRAWGEDGYLIDKGLIPLSAADRDDLAAQANALTPLAM
ncbi:MAG: substrate-binding domain-containing protein [Alphaproteobacteria bacterium]